MRPLAYKSGLSLPDIRERLEWVKSLKSHKIINHA
jgi:hypothetical protein